MIEQREYWRGLTAQIRKVLHNDPKATLDRPALEEFLGAVERFIDGWVSRVVVALTPQEARALREALAPLVKRARDEPARRALKRLIAVLDEELGRHSQPSKN